MPPKVKFQKEEIVATALKVACEKGIDAVTAREVASVLGVSTRPIFTWFDTMEQLKAEVFELAKHRYRAYIERGLAEPIPFSGVGRQYIRFAREEPELYRLLFLSKPNDVSNVPIDTFHFSQDFLRESLMRLYNMDASMADCYLRNLWLVVFSLATLIVMDNCPYTDEEISEILAEISFSICKAYKEFPGLSEGTVDKSVLFQKLVNKND